MGMEVGQIGNDDTLGVASVLGHRGAIKCFGLCCEGAPNPDVFNLGYLTASI
jgi:hypothetical protein